MIFVCQKPTDCCFPVLRKLRAGLTRDDMLAFELSIEGVRATRRREREPYEARGCAP